VEAIDQRYILVNETDKLAALTRILEVEEIRNMLIFVRTRQGSGDLSDRLSARGFPSEALNGDLSQEQRERVMNRFRNNKDTILVATDVAARGLDIDDISHVINYDLPEDVEVYIHRIGRTGRAGKTGIAISLVTPREKWRLRRIEKYAREQISRAEIPTDDDVFQHREMQLVNRVNVWLNRGRYRRERDLVTELIEAGNDPLEIAAAALKIARADEKQRPILPVSEVQERRSTKQDGAQSRKHRRHDRNGRYRNNRHRSNISHEEGMVRLTLSRGKVHGVRPNDVVSTIAYHANIPGKVIGKIAIQNRQTMVDIPEDLAEKVLAETGKYRIRQHRIEVELA
jgi:ATP-dependent RNA helicase DeaD